MLSQKSESYTAPSIQARVAEFLNNGDLSPYVVVENLGTSASVSIQYQESDNGSDWSPIDNTSRSINPEKSDGQVVVSNKRLIAVAASGGQRIRVSVIRQVNGPVTDLGSA